MSSTESTGMNAYGQLVVVGKTKRCIGPCKQTKPWDQFSVQKSNKTDGHNNKCKDCRKKYNAEYRETNKETLNAKGRVANMTAEQVKRKNERRLKRKQDPEKRERDRENQKKSAKKRKENGKTNTWQNEHRKNNPGVRIRNSLSTGMNRVMKGGKSKRTMEYVGCSIEYLKAHLKAQFTDGMTLENHGSFWDIDHMTPSNHFDHDDEEHQRRLWNFTNLQPLPIKENRFEKSNKMVYDKVWRENQWFIKLGVLGYVSRKDQIMYRISTHDYYPKSLFKQPLRTAPKQYKV